MTRNAVHLLEEDDHLLRQTLMVTTEIEGAGGDLIGLQDDIRPHRADQDRQVIAITGENVDVVPGRTSITTGITTISSLILGIEKCVLVED